MLAAVATSVTALVALAAPGARRAASLRTAALLLAQAVPAALVLFLLFPRVQGPLWGLPQDAYSAMSGLSDSMAPGSLSQLTLSDAIAFRVDFQGEPPPRRTLYWRGPVLWDFDGRTWRMGSPTVTELPRRATARASNTRCCSSRTTGTGCSRWRRAALLPPRTRYLDDGQIVTLAPVRARMRYDMVSQVEADPDARQRPRGSSRRALRLPAGSTRARARWPRAGARPAASDAAGARARDRATSARERLQYTTEPRLLGRDSVDEFLFDSREGFCEHFSSAFVFLMRAAGVPARVVTGYQGGDMNPVDQRFTVRQSDAHAWAEVFLAGRGWMRIDPTALSVPRRLDEGLARAVAAGDALPLLMRPEMAWLRSLRYNWEALTHQWNLLVLGYNPERQREFMSWFGMRDADWLRARLHAARRAGRLRARAVRLDAAAPARGPTRCSAPGAQFCRKLGARGVARAPHEGPRDFAERAARDLPDAGEPIRRIAALYIALRYGRDAAAAERVAELRRMVRELRFG